MGRYLHALQDSWSHQGVPDIPPMCNPQLAWGHSGNRGGWACHLADLTYNWDKDVWEMARATYDVLVAAIPNKNSTIPWQMLTTKVQTFADARTKWQKDEWFERAGFSERSFLQGISLPDCEAGDRSCRPYPFQRLRQVWNRILANDSPGPSNIPQRFVDLFEGFFSGVVQQRLTNVRELIDERLAAVALERAVHADGACPQLYETLFPVLLGKMFLGGRGGTPPLKICEITAAVHQKWDKGAKCDELVAIATEAVQDSAPRRGPALTELADTTTTGPSRPFRYTTTLGLTPETYVAFGRFIHLPQDVLVVSAATVNDRPRVTGFIWLPIQ